MTDAAPAQVIVHVTVERFFAGKGAKSLEELVSLTDRLDGVLAAVAPGWKRPSADEALLVGTEPWHGAGVGAGSPLDWAEALRRRVREALGLECSIGIARTRLAARVCSRLARPRGVLLWLSGYEDSLLTGMPLEELDELRADQRKRLRARGLRTLGELSGLDADEARELLGSDSERLLTLVRGHEASAYRDESEGGRFAEALDRLARRLARKLEREGRKARGLELRVHYGDGVSRERYTLLPRASRDLEELRSSARRLFAMSPPRGEPISGLALTATGLTGPTDSTSQLDLFGVARPRELAVRVGLRRSSGVDSISA